MKPLSQFERWILAQPIPELNLPALNIAVDLELWERAWILNYGSHIPRGEKNLRLLAITSGILPGSPEEIRELEQAGY
jgi:hypothetical protein